MAGLAVTLAVFIVVIIVSCRHKAASQVGGSRSSSCRCAVQTGLVL